MSDEQRIALRKSIANGCRAILGQYERDEVDAYNAGYKINKALESGFEVEGQLFPPPPPEAPDGKANDA